MDAMRPLNPNEGADEAIARLAAAQHGVFSRAQAAAVGATDSHLKHGVARYVRMRRAIFAMRAMAPSFEQRVMAVCLAGQATFASHRTAARLWCLAGIDDGVVEVTSELDRRGGPDVIVHRTQKLPDCDVTSIRAIPVTAPARTIIDLAAVVDETCLEIVLDDALRRGLLRCRAFVGV